MGVTNYHTVNGRIVGEDGPNGLIDYQVDALGSVVGTMDSSGSAQKVYRYKPYGAVLNDSGPGQEPLFRWVGANGYRYTGFVHSDVYIRARHFSSLEGGWTSVDLLWPNESAHVYAQNRPLTLSDPSGLVCGCVAGTCPPPADMAKQPGDGVSGCSPTGMWSWVCNNTCTVECTLQHEALHRKQLGPCCNTVLACAHDKKVSNEKKVAAFNVYGLWENDSNPVDGITDFTECDAWHITLKCVNHLYKKYKCANPTSSTKNCCTAIQTKQKAAMTRINQYCTPIKGLTAPPCPITGDCTIKTHGFKPI